MSNLNPSELLELPVDNDCYPVTYDDSPAGNKQTETVTQHTSFRLRFSSLTLDELSEQLERRTKETQKLQEEVENATRKALRRFGCTDRNSSPGQKCSKNDSAEESTGCSAHEQAVTQAVVCCLDPSKLDEVWRDRGSCETQALENGIDNCLEQLSGLQLNKAHSDKQETFCPQRAIMNLQIKLHEARLEKDFLSDQRLKDSRKHVDQMKKTLRLLEELQNIKRSADEKLQETENEASALHRKVELLEKSVQKVYQTLYEKQPGHNSTCNKTEKHQEPLQSAAHAYENFSKDADKQHQIIILSKEQQRNEEYEGLNEQGRVEDLITSLHQEMAMLTDKLSSSKHSIVNLCAKLELLKHLAERQTSLYRCQISGLESTVSSYNHKVGCLEKEILEIQTQLFTTQKERDQSLHQAKELQSQLQQLKSFCEKQQLELCEDTKVLSKQLGLARKQLCKAGEEKSYLQALLEQRSQERQTLQAEQEALILKLADREKIIDIVRLQIESSIQTTTQHSDTITKLQQENSFLINQHKQDIQLLKAELVQNKSDLVCLERERQQLQASLTEQNQRIQQETLEKQQVIKQLELQRMQLFDLIKEHEELQRLHSCKNEEHEGVVLKLQSQLRSAHDELDKIRCGLKTLGAANGHGIQVALDMQEEITARREEVDSLQTRIQHLEEKVEKLQQEKCRQNLETHRQLQELTFVREEKRQLASELKVLRSKDHQLRERISELEAILHKMWESLANCQDFLQLREQEYFRLKLQHAVNLKELPGQNLFALSTVSPPELNSGTPSTQTATPSSQYPYNTQIKENCACEFRSFIKKMQAAISDNLRPHTDKSAVSSCFHRRRSAPERQFTATFSAEQEEGVNAFSRPRRKTCCSEPRFLMATQPNGQPDNDRDGPFTSSPVNAEKLTTFPQMLSLGRRSPVHTLLTSNPNS
ncbi:coiled-coil domain-containing protein 158-like isoform X3 [Girardinichthys multiradiatus]|uniref:coiled-coil domain-containing protein 158-like isoform X3 n=1 Tax=Girardinichthys multiradiatus TaxID=208333 RepID=UPI001FAD8CC7|nr:coiled-coil domain-containing protein 158-like isoform X3 [Girardinichthys multiradiatus]XP_047238319.1 coiled-coil domain-containing protein 158-like isoform X3 [Girardinichthys multiradiatus]